MLVIPPATGAYNSRKECWRAQSSSLFTVREMAAIINLVPAGGRLLAFSYRFGDSFTQTNLRDLLSPLGCLLNHDAVIDLTRLRITQPSAMVDSRLPVTASSGWSVATQHVGRVLFVLWSWRCRPGAELHLHPGHRCLVLHFWDVASGR